MSAKAKAPRKDWGETLWWQLQAMQAHRDWQREYQFHPTRKWRFDLAHPTRKLAVEIEGLGPQGSAGRHQRIAGFMGDLDKYAEAWAMGWRVLRVSGRHVQSGKALAYIEREALTDPAMREG